MTDAGRRERAALGVLGLLLAMQVVAACGAEQPFAAVDNDPVPLPADLAAIVDASLGGNRGRLMAADAAVPPISASKAVAIAGEELLDQLESNNVPAQDPSIPDGVVRRLWMEPGRPPTSVWLVAYRWAAGFDCRNPNGGPGPCQATSFFFINDRTGETVYGLSDTR